MFNAGQHTLWSGVAEIGEERASDIGLDRDSFEAQVLERSSGQRRVLELELFLRLIKHEPDARHRVVHFEHHSVNSRPNAGSSSGRICWLWGGGSGAGVSRCRGGGGGGAGTRCVRFFLRFWSATTDLQALAMRDTYELVSRLPFLRVRQAVVGEVLSDSDELLRELHERSGEVDEGRFLSAFHVSDHMRLRTANEAQHTE
jgi:hypothetical protein